MQPHKRKMEIDRLQKQNTRHKSRPRRPNRGPTAVEWKKHGYKSKILGCNAAPAGLMWPHIRKMYLARMETKLSVSKLNLRGT